MGTRSLVTVAALAAVLVAPSVPADPGPIHEAVGEWGEPVNGLSMRLRSERSRFSKATSFSVAAEFHYDPASAAHPRRILAIDGGRASLQLRNLASGEVYARQPEDLSAPFVVRFDAARSLPDPEQLRDRLGPFFLMSRDGEYVPPGIYEVVAHYRNDGGTGYENVREDGGGIGQVPHDMADVWTGSLQSGPLAIVVSDVPDEEVAVAVPDRIRIVHRADSGYVAWRWSASREDTVRLVSKPGYEFRNRVECRYTVGGDSLPRYGTVDSSLVPYPFRVRGTGGLPTFSEDLPHTLIGGSAMPAFVTERGDLRAAVSVSVFETPRPGKDGLALRRELWSRTFEATWRPEEEGE